MQTRQKLKEAYDAEFIATIERAEKQIILAKHGRRLLQLLDDSPVVPGDTRASYEHGAQARQILNDVEDDLKDWQPDSGYLEPHVPQDNLTTKGKELEYNNLPAEPVSTEPVLEGSVPAEGHAVKSTTHEPVMTT